MTKADLVESIYEKVGFSKADSAAIVDSFFEILKDTFSNGDNVKISGFGTFAIKHKHSRKGRNPQTGSEITIPARKVLTFKPSHVLKKALNEHLGDMDEGDDLDEGTD
ncbi:MAG: integration host factor subunit alpha [Myxococcales bacterium]|nr:integration host factor subunit alpha [Myxococcales bacterium]